MKQLISLNGSLAENCGNPNPSFCDSLGLLKYIPGEIIQPALGLEKPLELIKYAAQDYPCINQKNG
jgi:hypothetical protein